MEYLNIERDIDPQLQLSTTTCINQDLFPHLTDAHPSTLSSNGTIPLYSHPPNTHGWDESPLSQLHAPVYLTALL